MKRAVGIRKEGGEGDRRFLASSFDAQPAEDDESTESFSPEDLALEEIKESCIYGTSSSRIAILNLDWDVVELSDIYRTIQPFLPSNSNSNSDGANETSDAIKSIKLYLSKYGKEMTEKEEKEGPRIEPRDNTEKSEKIAIRRYLVERMKYYYCVVEMDSTEVAEAVYLAIDGVEIGNTMNYIDSRFIPGDVEIEDQLVEEYSGKEKPGRSSSLQGSRSGIYHTRTTLRWEEDEKRKSFFRGLFVEDVDLAQAKHLIDMQIEGEGDKEAFYRDLLLKDYVPGSAKAKEARPGSKGAREGGARRSGKAAEEREPFKADMKDKRFSSVHTEEDYAIDHMDPAYRHS